MYRGWTKTDYKTSTALQTKRTKGHRTTEEEMGWRIKEQATRLTPLFEHDDDDDDDPAIYASLFHVVLSFAYTQQNAVCTHLIYHT
jgi:hypothetical protein